MLRIDDHVVNVREDLEFAGDPDVIAVGGEPEGDLAVLDLAGFEGLDHPVLLGHLADPVVAFDWHVDAGV